MSQAASKLLENFRAYLPQQNMIDGFFRKLGCIYNMVMVNDFLVY